MTVEDLHRLKDEYQETLASLVVYRLLTWRSRSDQRVGLRSHGQDEILDRIS